MGEINMPAQHFWPYPFVFTGYKPPLMVVFKPGYTLTVFNSGPTLTKREDVEQWTYNNQVIKMRLAIGDKEFAHAVERFGTHNQTFRTQPVTGYSLEKVG